MRDASSADPRATAHSAAETRRRAFADLPPRTLAIMLVCNTLPLLIVLSTLTIAWGTPGHLALRLAAGALYFYLAPALLTRLLLILRPIRGTRIAVGDSDFLTWWASACLQVIYSRFPMFEEALRLVPGLYSVWLRLWGSKVGPQIYWAPGVAILDRSWLRLGDRVVFGAGVRLNPHVLDRDAAGRWWLLLAPVTVGDRAMVGGYSLLTAGTEIAPDEVSTATIISPPFSRWQNGRRQKHTPPDAP